MRLVMKRIKVFYIYHYLRRLRVVSVVSGSLVVAQFKNIRGIYELHHCKKYSEYYVRLEYARLGIELFNTMFFILFKYKSFLNT